MFPRGQATLVPMETSMISLGVLACDRDVTDSGSLAAVRNEYDVRTFSDWKQYDPPTLLAKCRSVEVLLTAHQSPMLPAELGRDRGQLRYVCHARGSVRHVITRELIAAGLVITNWGDFAGPPVAEGAMALLLCLLKQIPTLDAIVKTFGPDDRICQEYPPTLRGVNVGLYGFGPIGKVMAALLEPFGAKVAVYDPYAQDVPPSIRRCQTLRELFATCPIISIHCGLNEQTANTVTAELLALLPQGGIVVNTARGAIVDEHALAAEVAAGRLLAGLDVTNYEHDSRLSPLAKLRGAILSGHAISGGRGYPPGKAPPPCLPEYVLDNLHRYRQGRPLVNIVAADLFDRKT